MITEKGKNVIATAIVNLIDHGLVTIGGTEKKIEIYRTTVVDNVLNIFLLLDDTYQGTITKKQLIDKNGNVVMDNSSEIIKDNSRSILIRFKVKVTEVIEDVR